MEKKAGIRNLKTYEEFKADQSKYDEVKKIVTEQEAYIKSLTQIKVFNNDSVDGMGWYFEGTLYLSELETDVKHDLTLTIKNKNDKDDISIDYEYRNKVTKAGTDPNSGPWEDIESDINVTEITYFKDDKGELMEYTIMVTTELAKLIKSIINMIAH